MTQLTTRSYELPDDLFDKDAGEAKPTKPQKKKTSLKRTVAEVEVGTSVQFSSHVLTVQRRILPQMATQSDKKSFHRTRHQLLLESDQSCHARVA